MINNPISNACALVLLLCAAAAAQTTSLEVKPGLIEVSVPAPKDANISWEARDPLDLQFLVFETSDHRSVCVLHLLRGRAVIISDVIDWDARTRTKESWIITVEGDAPDPDPDPEPDPPGPDLEGFALEVYQQVQPLRKPADAKRLADNFDAVVSQIAAGGVSSATEARDSVSEKNRALSLGPEWKPFGQWLGREFNVRARTLPGTRQAFELTAQGLRAVK